MPVVTEADKLGWPPTRVGKDNKVAEETRSGLNHADLEVRVPVVESEGVRG